MLGLTVMVRCWARARTKVKIKTGLSVFWPKDLWPKDRLELGSFILDIVITVGYVSAWAVASWNIFAYFDEDARQKAVFVFLLLSNVTVFTEFWPIINSTHKNPEKEHWLPWFFWTIAYTLLGWVTYQHHGLWTPLLMYPLFNMLTHATVGWLARPLAQKRSLIAQRAIPGE